MRRLIIVILILLLAGSCSLQRKRNGRLIDQTPEFSEVTVLQLREKLKDFDDRFTLTVSGAAEQIAARTTDIKIKKRTVYWKLITVPIVRDSIINQSAPAGLLDLWAFSVQMREYFEDGDGREIFGEWTSIALKASQMIEDDILEISRKIIPDKYHPKVKNLVDDFAEDNPIRGPFTRHSARPALVKASEAQSLQWVTDMPFAPFRVFMDEHAQAIREFAHVADNFYVYLKDVPETVRWNTELMLYDLEERQSVTSTLESFATISSAAQSLSETVKELPGELETRLTTTIEELDSKQGAIQQTLKEAQTTLDKLNESLASASTITSSVERSTANWSEAGDKWEKAVTAFDGVVKAFTEEPEDLETADVTQEEEGGFDIQDYTRTAERANEAVAQMRAFTTDFQKLLDSDSLESTTWKIAWSGVLIIVAFFASLLVYRLLVSRLAPGQTRASLSEKTSTAARSQNKETVSRP